MNKDHLSTSAIEIDASKANVWKALTSPEIMEKYFWGAKVTSNWKVDESITFTGEYKGNTYQEKGILLQVIPQKTLQYTHWSDLENLPDLPENYRTWTFDLSGQGTRTHLKITEDNIPTIAQKKRSDQFWKEVLLTIKGLLEIEDSAI